MTSVSDLGDKPFFVAEMKRQMYLRPCKCHGDSDMCLE